MSDRGCEELSARSELATAWRQLDRVERGQPGVSTWAWALGTPREVRWHVTVARVEWERDDRHAEDRRVVHIGARARVGADAADSGGAAALASVARPQRLADPDAKRHFRTGALGGTQQAAQLQLLECGLWSLP